jgi:phenylacetate-CoA ligase
VKSDAAAVLASLLEHLEASQWAAAEALEASQLRHLGLLAEHASASSPFFAERLAAARVKPGDLAARSGFASLPVMTRRDVQLAAARLHSTRVPATHGRIGLTVTSGSTGEPVTVRRTGVTALFWNALTMRELRWHRRDVAGRLCTIRARTPAYAELDDWGPPASLLAQTGPALALPAATDTGRLVKLVVAWSPTFLVLYPSTLAAFIDYCARHRVRVPSLQHVLTTGETLSAAVRADAEATLGAAVADCYSSEECGCIASQCPVTGLYHVMAESLIVEVLRDDAQPCDDGEVGRVVITDLHNYATPLVRYDTGDVAEAGPPCPCGRGLPTLRRIIGRQRNLIRLPDGRRHWPITGFPRCREVAPVLQYQLVQETRDGIDARLVVERPLSAGEEDRLRELFQQAAGYPFRMRFTYFTDRIPVGRSDKFEEFVCRV